MDAFQRAFQSLLDELESNRLEVILIPAREGDGKIRVAAWRNPDWYQALCSAHISSRKRKNHLPDTRIRRSNITRALRRLAAGLPSRSIYVKELTELAVERIIEEGEDYGSF